VHNLDSLIGQDIPVKIIKLNRRRGNVVVSRKLAVEEEINSRKSVTLEHLSEGFETWAMGQADQQMANRERDRHRRQET
jgi:predicted RNA-binding protein with RPS1 domain